MNRTWTIGTLFLLLLLMSGGCSGVGQHQPTPTPPAPIEILLLEPDLFPGWKQIEDHSVACSVLGCGDELESITRQFIKAENTKYDTITTQTIWRYSLYEHLTKAFLAGEKSYLPESQIDISPTKNISYTSTIAEHMYMFCYKIKSRVFCEARAQYGLYVVQFSSYIDQDNMSYDDYERMLVEIDKKMAPVADVR